MLADVDRRRADLLGDRDPLGRGARRRGRARAPGRRPPAAVRARREHGVALGVHRHAPAQRLPRAAHHRHRALPPRRGRAEVRRLAQQHVLACTSTSASRAPTAPCACATGCARCCRCCSPSSANSPYIDGRDSGLHSARTPDLHEVVPALRHPRRVRLLAGVGGLRRAARAHRLDRRVHAAVVVGAPAPRLRHRRGAHLRRPDDRRRRPTRSRR